MKGKFVSSFLVLSLFGSAFSGFIPGVHNSVLESVAYGQETENPSILKDAQYIVDQMKAIMNNNGLYGDEKVRKIEELINGFCSNYNSIKDEDSIYLLQAYKLISDQLFSFKNLSFQWELGYSLESSFDKILSICYPYLAKVSPNEAKSYYISFMDTLKGFADYYQQNYLDAFSHYDLVLIAQAAGKGVSTVKVDNGVSISSNLLNVETIKQSLFQINQMLSDLGVTDTKVEMSIIVESSYVSGNAQVTLLPEAVAEMKDKGIENIIIKSKIGAQVSLPLKDLTGKVSVNFKKDLPIAGGDGRISVDAPVYTFTLYINDQIVTTLPWSAVLTLQIPQLYPYSEENAKRHLELSKLSAYIFDQGNRWVPLVTDYHVSQGFLTFKVKGSGVYSGFVSNKAFSDVGADYWGKKPVEFLYAKGIVNGVSENLFEPERNITRAEFAKLLVKTFELEDPTATINFTDVKATDWFYKNVAVAYKFGLVKGVSETSFEPNRSITREEMVTMIVRALNVKQNSVSKGNVLSQYSDLNEVSDWAREAMEIAVQRGIIQGTSTTTLSPKETATRAMAAAMIDHYYEINFTVPYY